ncbi:hypothetical protein [Streptomyces sp. NPDC058735]
MSGLDAAGEAAAVAAHAFCSDSVRSVSLPVTARFGPWHATSS